MICAHCGKGFEPNPRVGMRQKFCCKKCSERAARKAQDRRLKAARLALRANRVCKRCGKIFTPKNSAGVYCSPQCQKKAVTERLRAERAAARGTRQCPVCGKTFAPKNSSARFCSSRCYNMAYRRKHHPERKRVKRKEQREKSGKLSSFNSSLCSSERRIREYLALPDAERYQRRGTLTPAELKMAEKMWNQMHGLRMV